MTAPARLPLRRLCGLLSGRGLLVLAVLTAGLAQAAPPAPPPFDRLLQEGAVELVFYDPAKVQREFPGTTTFHLSTEWKLDVNYTSRRRGKDIEVNVRARVHSITTKLVHRVELPEDYDHPQLWQTSLARHELDHVLLSTDPRVRILNEASLQSLKQYRFELPPGQKLTDQLVTEKLQAACNARHTAVTDLMQALQQRLDRVSRNGNRTIDDRRTFFREAYGKELLAELKFPYLEDVLKVVESKEYDRSGRDFVELHVPPP